MTKLTIIGVVLLVVAVLASVAYVAYQLGFQHGGDETIDLLAGLSGDERRDYVEKRQGGK